MAIIMDTYKKPEYPEGKSFYVKLFSKMIVENMEELEHFRLVEIPKKLNLSIDDRDRFNHIQNDIRSWLENNRLIENPYNTGSFRQLVIDAKELFKELENPTPKTKNPNKTVTNNYHAPVINDSTIIDSQVFQDSRFENSPNNISVKPAPIQKEAQSIWSKIWKWTDHKVIAQIIIILLGALLAYFGYSMLK